MREGATQKRQSGEVGAQAGHTHMDLATLHASLLLGLTLMLINKSIPPAFCLFDGFLS